MLVDEICNLGVFDLARLYRGGDVSPVEVVSAHLERCERLNPVLNAFLVLLRDSAIQAARAAEALFRAGVDLGPLQGVPISIKDIIRLRGTRTTAGSRVLLHEPADQNDATIVQQLRAGGAIIIGKTNLHEFASGNPEPNGPFGLVQNPRRIGYHPGSSSSGAGAAVAAGLGVIGLGTDTGGSIRIPAYLCGVAGLKPTPGRMNMEGIIPLSWTLDTVGPLARKVEDVAAALAVCSRDSLSGVKALNQSGDYSPKDLDQPVRSWCIGVLSGDFFGKVQPPVAAAFKRTLQILGDLGCQLIDFDASGVESMIELTNLITQAECATYHERYQERENLYGFNFLKERILPGRGHKAVSYLKARQCQLELQHEWLKRASQIDVLVAPTGPAVAPPHGATTIEVDGEHFPFRPLLSRFTRPFNLLCWPALTLPNDITDEGLPIGIQIVGPPDSEVRLLILGHQLEQAFGLVDKLGIEPRYPL